MGIFDTIQETAFNIVGQTFGCAASWSPSDGSAEQQAIVLYKDATEKHGLSDVDYNIERYVMEYKQGDFEGLKDAVSRDGNEKVTITIKPGLNLQFVVRRMETKYDGKTIIATLNPPTV